MILGIGAVLAKLDEVLVAIANQSSRINLLHNKIGELVTSNEVTQASLDAEGQAIDKLDADIKTYVGGLKTAFDNVVAAWEAEKANGLSSQNLDTAIANAQNDIAALPAITDPTQQTPAPAPTPDPNAGA